MMNKAVLIFPLMIFSLLAALWTGWVRIGWPLPISNAAGHHGALMVNCFLASLIFMERAVTFKQKWVLLLPLVNALSVVAIFLDQPKVAQVLFLAGSSGFIVMCVYFIFKYRESYYLIFLTGAFCLLAGNIILYRTNFYPNAVNWWMGFLLFTIVAERLELSRFLALTDFKRTLLWVCVAAVLVSLVWPFHLNGQYLLALSIALTATWLLKYDMARHAIKIKGQHRYSALLLITGYVWLLIMAVLLLFQNKISSGYDAVLHSFFIGFIFSMIFSHAVIILPAITKLAVKLYRPVLYVWFVLLQVSLVVRIIADAATMIWLRKMAGFANGIAILLFFVTIASIILQETAKKGQSKKHRQFKPEPL